MSSVVRLSTACVWTHNGRRYLTKISAYRSVARAMVNERCTCEPSETDERGYISHPGHACLYHADYDRYRKLLDRLARRLMRRDAAVQPASEVQEPTP